MINKISDEDLAFLVKLGKEMNACNNRGTQFPMFEIRQKVKRWVEVGEDWDERERVEDAQPYCLCPKCRELYDNDEDLPDDCDDCDEEAYNHYKLEDEIVDRCGMFFTDKQAQEHIDLNDYHYNQPFTYATGSWRNYDLQKVLEILSKLGSEDDKPLSHYQTYVK